jgi:hypothetical protein
MRLAAGVAIAMVVLVLTISWGGGRWRLVARPAGQGVLDG